MTELESPPPATDLTTPQAYKRRRKHRSRGLRRVRRFFRRINWLIVVVVVVGISAVAVMTFLVLTADATNRVWSSWSNLSRLLSAVQSKPGTALTFSDFERLQSSLKDMTASLNNATARAQVLHLFTGLSEDLDVGLDALDAAHELALSANDLLTGLGPTLFFLSGGEEGEAVVTQVSSGARLVELLRLGRGSFLNADAHLAEAQAALERLESQGVSRDLLLLVEDLKRYHDQLGAINRIVSQAPELLTVGLGLDEMQSYLVLSQNSDELRPSGGYISTFGWMNVRNARITGYNYSATTATSPNPPPATVADQIEVPDWWIQYGEPIYAAWDGSWYVDFPSTAQMSAWYYNSGDNPQSPVDGVMSVDLVGFEYIIGALGAVQMPGYSAPITVNNFRDVIYEVRAEGEGDLPHKRFLADLYRQILADWENIDRERSADLLGAVIRALQEKHIMLYFTDDQLNEAVNSLGWSGAQTPGMAHDYLLVADANLGNKSNRSVIRELTYDVEIKADGALQSRATVAYDYPATLAANDPAVKPGHYNFIDYVNLMQVFVPVGSRLTDTNNLSFAPHIIANDAHTIFVVQTEVQYNSGERFQFYYTTPPLVERFGPYNRYRLLLQKQPGMIGGAASVQVKLPPGARVVNASPAPAASYSLDQPILEFRVDLVTDQWIEVIYTE